jgi:hypothetical protein
MGKQSPEPCPTRGFKGTSAAPRLRRRAAVSAKHSPTRARTPAKQAPTHTMPRSPRSTDLQRLRAVMMERSRPSHRPKILAPTTTPAFTKATPTTRPQATKAIIAHKSSRVSLLLTHELGATSGRCARAHPPRTRRTSSTPRSSN